ncbi:MAG: hypothetical protein QW767_05355 [Thermoprotei archaeon]
MEPLLVLGHQDSAGIPEPVSSARATDSRKWAKAVSIVFVLALISVVGFSGYLAYHVDHITGEVYLATLLPSSAGGQAEHAVIITMSVREVFPDSKITNITVGNTSTVSGLLSYAQVSSSSKHAYNVSLIFYGSQSFNQYVSENLNKSIEVSVTFQSGIQVKSELAVARETLNVSQTAGNPNVFKWLQVSDISIGAVRSKSIGFYLNGMLPNFTVVSFGNFSFPASSVEIIKPPASLFLHQEVNLIQLQNSTSQWSAAYNYLMTRPGTFTTVVLSNSTGTVLKVPLTVYSSIIVISPE